VGLVLVSLAVSLVAALPIQGEETNLLQETSGLFPKTDDEATVTAEVNQAIQQDVNLDGLNDIGESLSLKTGASSWEKKAAADINAMSRDGLKNIKTEQDNLTSKFQEDIAEAKRRLAGPQKKVETESEIEKEADKALKDPQNAQKLKEEAEKAELDMESGVAIPMNFLQEDIHTDDEADIGDSDDIGDDNGFPDEDSQFALMGGSPEDVEKAINAQITQKVNLQLGSIPVDSEDGASLKQFEEDKAEAQKFVESKPEDKEKASADIQKQLAAAQAALKESQEAATEAEQTEEGKEEKEKSK